MHANRLGIYQLCQQRIVDLPEQDLERIHQVPTLLPILNVAWMSEIIGITCRD